jgi:hypothetical protein
MSGVIDGFVQSGGASGAPTAPNSRYTGLGTLTYTAPDGAVIRYLQRRLVPQPETYVIIKRVAVVQGDRIDNLANAQLGDPLLFWVLCDANAATDPDALTAEPGRTIGIPLSAGAVGSRSG